jgi:hypothetical protein
MGIGHSPFLVVVGAILTFAMDVNSSGGVSIDSVGVVPLERSGREVRDADA